RRTKGRTSLSMERSCRPAADCYHRAFPALRRARAPATGGSFPLRPCWLVSGLQHAPSLSHDAIFHAGQGPALRRRDPMNAPPECRGRAPFDRTLQPPNLYDLGGAIADERGVGVTVETLLRSNDTFNGQFDPRRR